MRLETHSEHIGTLSFFLIVMVVYIHAQCYGPTVCEGHPDSGKYVLRFLESLVSEGVCRVAVPLFFCLSGMLLTRDFTPTLAWYAKKVRRRFNSLVMPFLVWSVLSFAFFWLFQSVSYTRPLFRQNIIAEMDCLQIAAKLFWSPFCYQLWFVRELVVLLVIYPLIILLIRRAAVPYIAIVGMCWFLGRQSVFVSAEGLFFFSLGVFLILKDKTIPSGKMCLATWIVLVVTNATLVVVADYTSLVLKHIGIAVGVWAVLGNMPWLTEWFGRYEAISKYTFFIYAFHEPFLSMVKKSQLIYLPDVECLRIVTYMVNPVITISIAIFVARALSRNTPHIYGVLVGHR